MTGTAIPARHREFEAAIAELNANPAPMDLDARLHLCAEVVGSDLVFTTSFGLEDQLLTHAICRAGLSIRIVTLDTGRLFPETYEVWARTEIRYGIRIHPYYPNAAALEALIAQQGINGFVESVAMRKSCCFVRKVEPLGRALEGAVGWITGLRGGQSDNRRLTPFAELDRERGLVKINPLFDVDREDVASRVHALDIPYNGLHDRGFLSIGCAPCTRAVRVGEPERAGRWWWEGSSQECGLHNSPNHPAAHSSRYATDPSRSL
jgi:phosphoadenosine phosphosulfate reductase